MLYSGRLGGICRKSQNTQIYRCLGVCKERRGIEKRETKVLFFDEIQIKELNDGELAVVDYLKSRWNNRIGEKRNTCGIKVRMFDIKSPATFLEYLSLLKDAYLLEFMRIFTHSLKVQTRNPKMVYVMDMGLYTENSVSTSDIFEKNGLTIKMIPAHEYIKNNYSNI